ncbi:MAG: pyrroline-5-carboxylate reductase [Clostridia bacterium]|nr:pyrroline-5-carboxylate reductase [Clostridia bacterium]
MKKHFKLGVIGCGFKAHSILRGLVLSDFLSEKKIIVSDISEGELEKLNYLGVRTTTDNEYVAENCEFLVLAVNSANFEKVVQSFGKAVPEKIITVMSGVKKNAVKNAFGLHAVKVARGVINMPCYIGSGAIGLDMTDFKSLDDIEFISKLFDNLGTIVCVDESKMDAVSALSGCGPAYTFSFIDSLIDAGVKQGLPKSEAKILAVQTVLGAAEMVQREEQSLPELLMQSCGKGSVAIEGIKTFEEKNFRGIVGAAVDACVKRLKENTDK